MSNLELVFLRVLEVSLLAIPLLGLLLLIYRATRDASSSTRHGLLLAGLLGTTALFVLPQLGETTIQLPRYLSNPQERAPAAAELAHESSNAIESLTASGSRSSSILNEQRNEDLLALATAWASRIWLGGCLILLADLAIGLALVARTRRRAQSVQSPSSTARVFLVDVAGPLTFGAFPASILLPRTSVAWSHTHRKSVLAHELAHIERHDWLVQTYSLVLRAVLWFQPLLWWAVNRMGLEAEEACDQAVLRQGVRPSTYASVLLNTACGNTPSATVALSRRSPTARRIEAVLCANSPSGSKARTRLAAGALLALTVSLSQVSIVLADSPALGRRLPTLQARWSSESHAGAIFLRGRTSLEPQDDGVNSVEQGGLFFLATYEASHDRLRQLHVEIRSDGTRLQSYCENGLQRGLDAEGRAWLKTVLPQARQQLRDGQEEFLLGGLPEDPTRFPLRLSGSTLTGSEALTRDGGKIVAGRLSLSDTDSLFFFKGGTVRFDTERVKSVSDNGWLITVSEDLTGVRPMAVWTTRKAGDDGVQTSTWRDGAPVSNEHSLWTKALAALSGVDWLRTP